MFVITGFIQQLGNHLITNQLIHQIKTNSDQTLFASWSQRQCSPLFCSSCPRTVGYDLHQGSELIGEPA